MLTFEIDQTSLVAISEPKGWNGHVESVKARAIKNGYGEKLEWAIQYVLELQGFEVKMIRVDC